MNKVLIIAVLGAALIIGGAVMYVKKDPVPEGPPPLAFDKTQQQVVIDNIYQVCTPNDRCIVVDTHCGFCCKYKAINARYEKEFNSAFDKSCRRFMGTYCQCFDLSSYPKCVNGLCQLVQWPDDQRQASPITPAAQPKPEPEPVYQYEPPPVIEPEPAPYAAPAEQQEPQTEYVAPEPDPLPEEPQTPLQEVRPNEQLNEPLDRRPEIEINDAFGNAEQEDDLFAPLPETMPTRQEPRRLYNNPLDAPLPAGKIE